MAYIENIMAKYNRVKLSVDNSKKGGVSNSPLMRKTDGPARGYSSRVNSPIGKNAAIKAERMAKSLSLRKKGWSLKRIAEEVGVCQASVGTYLREALTALHQLALNDMDLDRQLELERLDGLYSKLAPGIEAGDPRSVEAALRISGRRAKLLGMDAPIKSEITGADGERLKLEVNLKDLSAEELETLARISEKLTKPSENQG